MMTAYADCGMMYMHGERTGTLCGGLILIEIAVIQKRKGKTEEEKKNLMINMNCHLIKK